MEKVVTRPQGKESIEPEAVEGWDKMFQFLENNWEVVEELEGDTFLMKRKHP